MGTGGWTVLGVVVVIVVFVMVVYNRLVALRAGRGDLVGRCHPHDPSWQNWPVLEHAIIGNIVPDFPLINKSFNLSYSGHDL